MPVIAYSRVLKNYAQQTANRRPHMAEATSLIATEDSSSLERTIGFWGLTFVSLGSIIGAGWLLGALGAATVAGPASLIWWVVAAVIIGTLPFIHAKLATTYPVAGGTARYVCESGKMASILTKWKFNRYAIRP
jgi:amino acid transporter